MLPRPDLAAAITITVLPAVSARAVCVHTKKVYDSCRSKECLRDIRVYLCRDAQELLNAGGIASVKPRAAELLCVKIDVEHVQFKRGL